MRVEGWESLLADYVAATYAKRFAWGTCDCALWAAEWVRLATGTDFGIDWRGKYKTEAGAARLMKKRGLLAVADIADAALEPIPAAMAQRGDLLLHPSGALGVCYGRHGFFLTPDSVVMIDSAHCPRGWKVG